jgi:pilus assembly protein CpaF
MGRPADESISMMDSLLPDGSLVTSIFPPLSVDGPMLAIRRFSPQQPNIEELIQNGFISQEIAEVLRSIVLAKLNILISGGKASGKTTLLNILTGFIPNNEKVFIIEE